MKTKVLCLLTTLSVIFVSGIFAQNNEKSLVRVTKSDLIKILADNGQEVEVVFNFCSLSPEELKTSGDVFIPMSETKQDDVTGFRLSAIVRCKIADFREFLFLNTIDYLLIDSIKIRSSNLLSNDEVAQKMKQVFDVPRMEGMDEPADKNSEEYINWKIFRHEKKLFSLMNNYNESLIAGHIDRQQDIIEHWKSKLLLIEPPQPQKTVK